jgi:hypothetical protein
MGTGQAKSTITYISTNFHRLHFATTTKPHCTAHNTTMMLGDSSVPYNHDLRAVSLHLNVSQDALPLQHCLPHTAPHKDEPLSLLDGLEGLVGAVGEDGDDQLSAAILSGFLDTMCGDGGERAGHASEVHPFDHIANSTNNTSSGSGRPTPPSLTASSKPDLVHATMPAQPHDPQTPLRAANGEWEAWVLRVGAKERNQLIKSHFMTGGEATDLKQKSRRTKQTDAQRRYFKRQRIQPEAPGGDGPDGGLDGGVSPRGSWCGTSDQDKVEEVPQPSHRRSSGSEPH